MRCGDGKLAHIPVARYPLALLFSAISQDDKDER